MGNWYLDLINQVVRILPIKFGGTGNSKGWAHGVIKACVNQTDVTLTMGTVVQLLLEGDDARVTLASPEESTAVIGVVVGYYTIVNGHRQILEGDAPDNGLVAVMFSGTCRVQTTGTVVRGQYAYTSASDGIAKALDASKPGAFGRFQSQDASGFATVVLGLTTLNFTFGEGTDIHPSLFGDVADPGDSHLAADANHTHLREPDISALVTGPSVATASTAKVAHPASHAVDGDAVTTYWESDGGATPSFKVDLALARQIVRAIVVQKGNGGNNFTQYTLAWSDDDITYHNVVTRTSQGAGVTDEAVLDAVITARYWRWTVGSLTGNAQVYEFDVRAVPYGPIDPVTGMIPTEFGGGGGGASSLDDLTDVTITTPADADRVRYDAASGQWLNSTRVWVPLTTTLAGDPTFVWDADDNLVLTEVVT